MKKTCLYRLYNAADELLYVGCTVSPTRLNDHRQLTTWWDETTKITLEHFASRDDAMLAELIAIRFELPRYNVSGARDPEAARANLRASREQFANKIASLQRAAAS